MDRVTPTQPAGCPAIVITGPTAGGKGGLAQRVARRLGAPVLSLDSMKVYRGLDIGTAKPPAEAIASTPFRLVDLRDPEDSFSIGDYLDELAACAPTDGTPWLLAGGTGFYLHALREGLFVGPGPDPYLRRELRARAEREGPRHLHDELARRDPEAAAAIAATDMRRVIRALEVMHHCAETFSVLQKRRQPVLRPDAVRLVGIARARSELHARIDARVVRMFEAGWPAEVEALCARRDPPWSPQADQSIGYARIRAALAEGRDPREEIPTIQARTRKYARHQLVWFRKMPVEWWAPEELDELLDHVANLVEVHRRTGSLPAADPDRRSPEGH